MPIYRGVLRSFGVRRATPAGPTPLALSIPVAQLDPLDHLPLSFPYALSIPLLPCIAYPPRSSPLSSVITAAAAPVRVPRVRSYFPPGPRGHHANDSAGSPQQQLPPSLISLCIVLPTPRAPARPFLFTASPRVTRTVYFCREALFPLPAMYIYERRELSFLHSRSHPGKTEARARARVLTQHHAPAVSEIFTETFAAIAELILLQLRAYDAVRTTETAYTARASSRVRIFSM